MPSPMAAARLPAAGASKARRSRSSGSRAAPANNCARAYRRKPFRLSCPIRRARAATATCMCISFPAIRCAWPGASTSTAPTNSSRKHPQRRPTNREHLHLRSGRRPGCTLHRALRPGPCRALRIGFLFDGFARQLFRELSRRGEQIYILPMPPYGVALENRSVSFLAQATGGGRRVQPGQLRQHQRPQHAYRLGTWRVLA
ncbi:hypothetical protein PSEUDO8AS_60196 [Pseudomonas sp. 8AS]|nr:hypothetical protein PSEUDO8AS_60196 [Pseudomonas sp. 8AS]